MNQFILTVVNDMIIRAAKAHLNGEMTDAKFYELLELASGIYEVKAGA